MCKLSQLLCAAPSLHWVVLSGKADLGQSLDGKMAVTGTMLHQREPGLSSYNAKQALLAFCSLQSGLQGGNRQPHCMHALMQCDLARRLCEVTKKPPLCPFCRSFIEGFHCLQACD